VRNRPDWVGIPLGAVAALVGATPTADQTLTGEKE
jgi:predicted trehalose synthase